jgi:hypothetical protein
MIALVGHVSAALSIDSKSLPGVKLVGVLETMTQIFQD